MMILKYSTHYISFNKLSVIKKVNMLLSDSLAEGVRNFRVRKPS